MIPVLKLKKVTKYYGKKKVVDSVNFSLFPGQVFGFIGPNGAGKSTTIKMICGLTSISGGAIYVNGYNVERCFKKAIQNVGAVVESPQLYPYLTGYKNLKLFSKFYGKQAEKRITNIMRLTGVNSFANKKVSSYSLGMKQRLGIAQALLNKPKLLILDDSASALDCLTDLNLRKALKKDLNCATVLISQRTTTIKNADLIIVLDHGDVVGMGKHNDLLKNCAIYRETYFSQTQREE